MEQMSLATYAIDMLEPNVAGVLYQISRQFTCNDVWQGPPLGRFDGRRMEAKPLSRDHHLQNYPAISVSAHATIALGECTWHVIAGMPIRQGPANGLVRLDAGLHANFSVDGYSKSFTFADGTSGGGFLCWADQFSLADGSTCIRLNTPAGGVWIRGGVGHGVSLMYRLRDPDQAPMYKSRQVVHLAEHTFDYELLEPRYFDYTPWAGLSTRDTAGRQWIVEESVLRFGAALGLDRSNVVEVAHRQHLVVQPPYSVIWAPKGKAGMLVPMERY